MIIGDKMENIWVEAAVSYFKALSHLGIGEQRKSR
jgi:hypothetical protein